MMKQGRMLSLFAASMCGMLMTLGCGAAMEEEAQAGAAVGTEQAQAGAEGGGVEQGGQPSALFCHPRTGTTGSVWATESAYSLYMYRDDWCGVGSSLPEQCWNGTYYYYQQIRGYSCAVQGSNGSCYDEDAWWYVTCNSLIQCEYDCEGFCYPTSC
jgi:hypothetical protein